MLATRLSSSLIVRVAYDEEARILKLWFRDGGPYLYFEVPKSVYEALCRAASAGRYFNECVKGRYRCAFDPSRKRYRPGP